MESEYVAIDQRFSGEEGLRQACRDVGGNLCGWNMTPFTCVFFVGMQPLKNHSGGKKVLPESTALFEQNRKVKSAYQCCQDCASRVLGE